MYNYSVVLLLCSIGFSIAIIDLEEPTTKPPRHREDLPWPSRSQYEGSRGVKTSHRETSTRFTQSPSPSEPSQRQRVDQQPPKLPPALATNKQPLCPYKATGQFPYPADCRRFVNCFKGRGMVQVCSPGTLFNPLTQECDFPNKVTCLDTKAQYQVLHQQHQPRLEENDNEDDHVRQGRPQLTQNEDWKRGFKSYKVTRPPDQQSPPYNGHGGVQPPYSLPNLNYFGQPIPDYMVPPPVGMPSPMLQPPPPHQPLNMGSPFNIPPMLYGGSPNASHPAPVNTYGTPNPGYYIIYQQRPPPGPGQPVSFPQNQPGYPVYPEQPVEPINPPVNNPSSPRGQLPATNNPQLFSGGQPGYGPDQTRGQPVVPQYYPSGPQNPEKQHPPNQPGSHPSYESLPPAKGQRPFPYRPASRQPENPVYQIGQNGNPQIVRGSGYDPRNPQYPTYQQPTQNSQSPTYNPGNLPINPQNQSQSPQPSYPQHSNPQYPSNTYPGDQNIRGYQAPKYPVYNPSTPPNGRQPLPATNPQNPPPYPGYNPSSPENGRQPFPDSNPQNLPQYPNNNPSNPQNGRRPLPNSDPQNPPQYPVYNPNNPQNGRQPLPDSDPQNPPQYPVYNPNNPQNGRQPLPDFDPHNPPQYPVYNPNNPQNGRQPLPDSDPRNPPQYPAYNPSNPQTGRQPLPDSNPQNPPQYPAYNPSNPKNGRQFPNSNPHEGIPSDPNIQSQSGQPQSREPNIYPQGGQPGYFMVDQNGQESERGGSKQPLKPPKYNPSDSTRHNVKCPAGASGLFPHPDCFKFLSCDHGRTFVMSCGPGTAFNPTISTCDYPENVNCGQTSSQPEDDRNEETPDYDNSQTNWEQNVDPTFNVPENQNPPDDEDQHSSPSELVEIMNNRGNFEVDPWEIPTTIKTTTTTTRKPATTTATTRKPATTTEKSIPKKDIRQDKKVPFTPKQPEQIKDKIVPNTTPSTVTMSVKPPKKKIGTRDEPPPISKQLARLRGGSKANEGYLEMRGLKEWGLVCDRRGEWTLTEANIVCKQLGYERGAELTWQGRPSDGRVKAKQSIAFSSVWCQGNETNILDCTTRNDKPCKTEEEAVWIRCHNNPQSLCHPGEAVYQGKCYSLEVPREDGNIDSIGFSQGEAISHCQLRRGHLLDIISQSENDFISEWLVSLNVTSNIMTSGVGVSVMGASIWIWEGSPDMFKYSNWWPGWNGNETTAPGTKSNRALCVIGRRYFPCPVKNNKTTAETTFCDAEYFFWDTEDCAIMSNKHPYVCKREADDIGCVINNGHDYSGKANVSETSTGCLSWDSPNVKAALKYRVSESTFRSTLAGHNYCRNLAGSDPKPWCYVQEGNMIKKEACDIPDCRIKEDKIKSERASEYTCGPNLFACDINDCIPSAWVCDGQPDCSNGYDEMNCTGGLAQFTQHKTARLVDHDKEKWLHTSAANCATRCLQASDFICRSFSHYGKDQICLLSESNIGLSGKLVSPQPDWEYYERISHSVDCSDMFRCGTGKCINKTATCNGKNDCGDRSDERNCSATNLGYEIRLGGSNKSHEGRIEIKILGEWGYVCDDQFDLRDAEVVCKELGFSLGAAEIRPHSAFLPINTTKTLFLVDDLQCRGNETTIRECDFGGWGVHDCGNEEVVGVVCKVPGLSCANNFWQCKRTYECIPLDFLCDNIPDCEDGSDEDVTHCKQAVTMKLVNDGGPGSHSLTTIAGRVEVKRFGVWGTVCDDDFGEAEAAVVCNSLGYKGAAQVKKEAAYGAGSGPIWLDGVHCVGNETSLELCLHEPWGRTDCSHKEDVSVICSHGPSEIVGTARSIKGTVEEVPNILSGILPVNCGAIDDEVKYLTKTDTTPKVVKGQEIVKGTIPWQASLRVRTSIKSVHWCGAVILSPLHILTSAHCLQDYAKSAYFVRVGDFDTEVPEGTEQEHDIETTYIHEDFNKDRHLNNDLALIKLKGTGLQFSMYVRAVCLPPPPTAYVTGANCTISGWGSNGMPGAGYSRRLRATSVPIISEAECKAPYVYGESLSEGMFCAGDLQGGSDSCQGDSGGPFVCPVNGRSVLYGLTSWGHGCGRANKPGVYTKVAKYISWINTKIQDSLNGR